MKDDSSTVIQTNEFDGLNRRIQKVVGSDTYDYYYNNQWQVLEIRKNGSGNPWKQYAYHPEYVDAIAVRFYDEDTDGSGVVAHYYLQDANFNVTAATDNAGTVQERYTYTPYGEVTFLASNFSPLASTAIANEYLYTGRRRDPETGLELNRNRFYHSGLGRWVNRDPIGYWGGLNLYQYVGSMPTRFVDPTGLYAWWPPSQWWPWGEPEPQPEPDPGAEATKKLCKAVRDKMISKCSKLPGMAGKCAQLTKCVNVVLKGKKSCEELDDIKDKCEDFANNPDYVGCFTCCKALYETIPAAGNLAVPACESICSPWSGH